LNHRSALDLSSAYNIYPPPHPTLGTSQPPPSITIPYVHHGSTPEQLVYSTPSNTEIYLDGKKDYYIDRPDHPYSGNPKSSVPIVTLNPNNFIGNPSKIRYLAEASRKRPNTVNVPETELDSLNAKRLKNREAARRWRQGKKEQISDLQGEVNYLKTKIDAMQTEMETLRIENQYLKQELSNTRQPKISQPPPQSPNLLSLSSHPYRPTATSTPNDINLLPTPSIFLLCLFVFSLCLSLPTSPSSFPGTDHSLVSYMSIPRQPRLLDSTGTYNYDHTSSDKILAQANEGNHNWIIAMFSQVYQRLLPNNLNLLNQPSLGLLKVPTMGDMNKRLSSSLRLDKFL